MQAGKPVADANITFHGSEKLPADLRDRMGKTDAQGMYKIADVYPGDYTVMVQKFQTGEVDPTKVTAEGPASDPLAKYGADSPLKASVAADKKEFNFDLD